VKRFAVLALVLGCVFTGALPAPAQTTGNKNAATAGVSLVSQNTWVRLRSTFTMDLHLDNPTIAARPGAAIAIRVHESASSRIGFDDVIANRNLGSTLYQPDPILVSSLPQDRDRNVRVTLGLSGSDVQPTIGIRQPGVYPVEVSLTNTGEPSGSFVTWLVAVAANEANPLGKKLAVSFGWSLVAPPAVLPDGKPDAGVVKQMQPSGRLDKIATLLARAGEFPYSLEVGPETAQAWQTLAQRDPEAAAGFTRVRRAASAATTELMPTSYVPINVAALEAAGMGSHLSEQYLLGANALKGALGVAPSEGTRSAFVNPVSDAAVDRQRQMLADRIAVRDSALVPSTHRFTPSQTFVLATPGGRSRGAATAPFLEQLLDGPDPAPLRAHRLIAALAEVAYETPGISRGVVLAAPQNWTPDLDVMTVVVEALRDNPLIRPTTLDDFFTFVSNEQDDADLDVERRLVPQPVAGMPLSASEYDEAVARLASYRTVVGTKDPAVVQGEQAIALALSTDLSSTQARAYLGGIDAAVQRFTSAITTDAKRVTLTARKATVPLTIVNHLEPARAVRVRVHLDSPKLLFPEGADKLVTLQPGNNTVEFELEARASGTFAMTIDVHSANGELAFGPPVRVSVRSAAFGGWAVALTVGAVVFLALWWAYHFRRTRRGRGLSSAPAPSPAT
jgi:hypothetical protein